MGRPSEYNEEIANKLCDMMISGVPLRAACEALEINTQIVFSWIARNKEFCERYALAREAQMECYAHELTELADGTALSAEAINKARLQIDTRKWIMSKLKAKKYGDHATLQHTGNVQIEQLVIQRTPKTIEHEPKLTAIDVID